MKSTSAPAVDKTEDAATRPESGYDAYKHAKVLRGLAEAQDRSKLIPSELVWKDLGLER